FDGIIRKPFKEQDLLSVFSVDTDTDSDVVDIDDFAFDTTALVKMTFGDRRQLNKILHRFVEDCHADMALLDQSLKAQHTDNLSLLLHRLAGRIAQMGVKQLAAEFRTAEIALARYGM